MKNYKTKSGMFGYNIGINNDSLYVAIPKKYLVKEAVEVTFNGDKKIFTIDDVEGETTQKDKYNGGMNYTICYVCWQKFNNLGE